MRRCRWPFAGNLNSTSGPDVLVAALSEALRGDPRFEDLNAHTWFNDPTWGEDGTEYVPWFPVGHHLIPKLMAKGNQFAIGPNVLFGDSQQPGACGGEPELLAYQNFAAIFTLSRWYSALQQKHFAQKARHFILDYPLPQAWIDMPVPAYSGSEHLFAFIKGGEAELAVFAGLQKEFGTITAIRYGAYKREQLFIAAQTSAACFYISREDHYPLAAVEIGLMGCPIISDEKICSVVQHGITGIIAPVRERGESDGFRWTADAAERMAVERKAAAAMNRNEIREATIRKHSPQLLRERVAAQLGLG